METDFLIGSRMTPTQLTLYRPGIPVTGGAEYGDGVQRSGGKKCCACHIRAAKESKVKVGICVTGAFDFPTLRTWLEEGGIDSISVTQLIR